MLKFRLDVVHGVGVDASKGRRVEASRSTQCHGDICSRAYSESRLNLVLKILCDTATEQRPLYHSK